MRFAVAVNIMPKKGISDPQGATIERALPSLGVSGASGVRAGKRIELVIEAPDQASAATLVEGACARFLANPVIEEFEFSMESAGE